MAYYFLQNAWYAPNGQYFEAARVFPVDIPDALVPFLPKSAEAADANASRARPQPAIMANIKTLGAPIVNSHTLFADLQAKTQAAKPAEEPKAAEVAPAEPLPSEVLAEQAAAEQFAEAQQQEQEPVAVVKKEAPQAAFAKRSRR